MSMTFHLTNFVTSYDTANSFMDRKCNSKVTNEKLGYTL